MGAKLLLLSLCLLSLCFISTARNVTYDNKSIIIDGQRKLIISGAIHYPRSTVDMWPDLIQKAKDGGLDTVETYIFWNAHEPEYRQYDFSGNKDFIKFIKIIQEKGLNCILRIGPYVCAEWTYGGFPVWLHHIPGIEMRTYNEPFMNEMKIFTTLIVDMVKKENLFASQGGPIILAQIENEYGNVMNSYGAPGQNYIVWAAKFAESLNIGVPWIMCQQSQNLTYPVIGTHNGHYGDADKDYQSNNWSPKWWTENWVGWFEKWGDAVHHRPAEDTAFAVARFYQLDGTLQNYYMYHGGTNFGRTAGGPMITTAYGYDAPLDEYGNLNQPKWGHLKELHKVIHSLERVMLYGTATTKDLDGLTQWTMFELNGTKACFLANSHDDIDKDFEVLGKKFTVPPWSVTILENCQTEVYNTAKVKVQTAVQAKKPISSSNLVWQSKHEQPPHYEDDPTEDIIKDRLFLVNKAPDIKILNDTSDYLWYMTQFTINYDDPIYCEGNEYYLHLNSTGPVLHLFLNGKQIDNTFGQYSSHGSEFQQILPHVSPGEVYHVSLLLVNMGFANYDAYFDTYENGVFEAKVTSPNNEHSIQLTKWQMRNGLNGYHKGLTIGEGDWHSDVPKIKNFYWYKTEFDTPSGSDPLVLDLHGMGKGLAWVNGNMIGRYWPSYYVEDHDGCHTCNYAGPYDKQRENKCLSGCGNSTQRWYHIPRGFLNDEINTLVLFEEFGGDVSQVSISTVQTEEVSANVAENTTLVLSCQDRILQQDSPGVYQSNGKYFTHVKFASFGDATRASETTVQSFQNGSCDSPNTLAAVKKACLGKEMCVIDVSEKSFGPSSCRSNVPKKLSVSLKC